MNRFSALAKTAALALAIAVFATSPSYAGRGGGGHGGGGHGGGHGGGGYHGGGYHGGGYHGGGFYGGRGYYGGGYFGGLGYGGYYGGGYGYPYSGYYGASYPGYTYSSGYSYPPTGYSAPDLSQPYLTNQTYEPGDGYRYPLYYNPATGTYFYYPVAQVGHPRSRAFVRSHRRSTLFPPHAFRGIRQLEQLVANRFVRQFQTRRGAHQGAIVHLGGPCLDCFPVADARLDGWKVAEPGGPRGRVGILGITLNVFGRHGCSFPSSPKHAGNSCRPKLLSGLC